MEKNRPRIKRKTETLDINNSSNPIQDGTSNGFTGSQAKDADLTGWELALVSTSGTDISSFKERQLGGGLDSVTLNSLYDEGVYRAAQQPVYGAPAPNPFETGDPFVTGPQTGAVVPHESNPFGPFEPQPNLMMAQPNPFVDSGFGSFSVDNNHPQATNPWQSSSQLHQLDFVRLLQDKFKANELAKDKIQAKEVPRFEDHVPPHYSSEGKDRVIVARVEKSAKHEKGQFGASGSEKGACTGEKAEASEPHGRKDSTEQCEQKDCWKVGQHQEGEDGGKGHAGKSKNSGGHVNGERVLARGKREKKSRAGGQQLKQKVVAGQATSEEGRGEYKDGSTEHGGRWGESVEEQAHMRACPEAEQGQTSQESTKAWQAGGQKWWQEGHRVEVRAACMTDSGQVDMSGTAQQPGAGKEGKLQRGERQQVDTGWEYGAKKRSFQGEETQKQGMHREGQSRRYVRDGRGVRVQRPGDMAGQVGAVYRMGSKSAWGSTHRGRGGRRGQAGAESARGQGQIEMVRGRNSGGRCRVRGKSSSTGGQGVRQGRRNGLKRPCRGEPNSRITEESGCSTKRQKVRAAVRQEARRAAERAVESRTGSGVDDQQGQHNSQRHGAKSILGEGDNTSTCGGVVGGALLATKMVVAAKALATEMGVKAKARCAGHVSEMDATEKTTSVPAGIWKLHDTQLLFAFGNHFSYALAFTNAALDLFPKYEQINSHAGDKRYEFLEAENNRVHRELVAAAAKRCMMRSSYHLHLLRLVFVSENQDQISTKNESEVGLAQGTTGVNDAREHVQELERECANMKYEVLEVKTKRGWSFFMQALK
ncbi:hypothetical protein Tco_0367754 [Tanacetum coccineum]